MVTSQMLKFALGRDLQYFDEPTVQQIGDTVIENDYSAATLVAEVIQSYPFRFRKGDGSAAEGD